VTLSELERSLPNGLHDAQLVSIDVNFASKEATLGLNIDVSPSDAQALGNPEYRAVRIRFLGLEFVVIDPPVTLSTSGPLMIDSGSGQPKTAPCQLPQICHDCFLCWIFVSQSNSFIRICARHVQLE